MSKCFEYPNANPAVGGVLREFWCPGCKMPHVVDSRWGFNGDFDNPTFTPSVLVQWGDHDGHAVCHSFITDGSIQYLGDCTHMMAGQTVPLPEHPPMKPDESWRRCDQCAGDECADGCPADQERDQDSDEMERGDDDECE